MSKAQDLLKQRKALGSTIESRAQTAVEGAESMESYYENILTPEDIDKALEQYGDNFEAIQNEFIEKTRIQGADIGFLFFGVLLHVVKTILLNKMTEVQKANEKGKREDKLHEVQEKILGKFSNGGKAEINGLNASLETIISTRGVPYDATGFKYDKLGLFKGANHRFSTLGHDPALGMIFGTANILTSTITTNKFETYHVEYDNSIKNPRIGLPVGVAFAGTLTMLKAAADRFDGDIKSVVAAVIKQLIHIATDMYTPCGIQLPGAGLVLSNSSVEKLTGYISTGDVIKIGTSAGASVLINTIISAVHGCKFIFNRNNTDESEFALDLYQARTRKVVMYSNIIASSSNIIAAIFTEGAALDIGGLAVTLYRLFCDTRFICKLEYEFINSGLSEIYDNRYDEVKSLYGE